MGVVSVVASLFFAGRMRDGAGLLPLFLGMKKAPPPATQPAGANLINALNRFLNFLNRLLHIRRWGLGSRAYPDGDFVECVEAAF